MNMKNLFNLQKVMIALLGFCLAAPGVVPAAQDNSARGNQLVVSYADLDLTRDEAVVVLYQRLKHAARSVCGTTDYGIGARIIPRSVLQARQACAVQALDQAVAGVHNPHLTALHNQADEPGIASNP